MRGGVAVVVVVVGCRYPRRWLVIYPSTSSQEEAEHTSLSRQMCVYSSTYLYALPWGVRDFGSARVGSVKGACSNAIQFLPKHYVDLPSSARLIPDVSPLASLL